MDDKSVNYSQDGYNVIYGELDKLTYTTKKIIYINV